MYTEFIHLFYSNDEFKIMTMIYDSDLEIFDLMLQDK